MSSCTTVSTDRSSINSIFDMSEVLRVSPYPVEQAAAPATVAVTGVTGYLAGSIVERLLALGHTVHGTCRDPAKAKELQVR